jgi:acetyl-CoA C-acetyltransferase
MSLDPWRTPVVIGAAQCVERDEVVTPLDLLERAASETLSRVPGLACGLDEVHVAGILFGGGEAPASKLCRRLGVDPPARFTTTIGGNTPQWLVGRAADRIAAGTVGTVLIAGAEAVRSQRVRPLPTASTSAGAADPLEGDPRPGLSEAEMAAGLAVPAQVYPLFESVLAARAGRTPAQQRSWLGGVLAPFAEVAADNPFAWFRQRLSAEEIATPSPDNRVAAEPYTKRMNAFLNVDQSAALVVTSLGKARELGAAEGCAFVWAAADANDVWNVSERPELADSPAIAAAGEAVLAAAGVGIDDIAFFDLYSCFPSAVEMAAAALGLDLGDSRRLTVTGGLPYFGGPGNNYTTHAIASLSQRLRDGGGLGLISGLGWYCTKHSLGVYGAEPPPAGYRRGDTSSAQRAIDATRLDVVGGLDRREEATVEASTVLYDRKGQPVAAPAVATFSDGRRVVAAAAPDELRHLDGRLIVGTRVAVEGSPPRYRVVAEARDGVVAEARDGVAS